MSAVQTPWQRYQADLKREGFSHDPAQEAAVRLLQDLYERLLAAPGESHITGEITEVHHVLERADLPEIESAEDDENVASIRSGSSLHKTPRRIPHCSCRHLRCLSTSTWWRTR